jgi:hypothetical protein
MFNRASQRICPPTTTRCSALALACTIYRRRRQALLGHANYGMAGHYVSADVGRLIKC